MSPEQLEGATRADRSARLQRLELTDVRALAGVTVEPDPAGTTVLIGPNGSGKTTILESLAFLGTQRSFRVSAREAMIRVGCERSVIRGMFEREGRPLQVEAELATRGQVRTLINHQPARSRRDLAGAVTVTVFSPADLALIQGPPQQRRDLLDDALRAIDVSAGAALDDLDRALRQRSALLRQTHGRLSTEIERALDVWDERMALAGGAVASARRSLLVDIEPLVAHRYRELSGGDGASDTVVLEYRAGWGDTLGVALAEHREDDVRRGVCTTGPHRDDVATLLTGRDARIQASQGEQRSLALSLRLAVHEVVTWRTGAEPIVLLDDVFSELDDDHCAALVRLLPAGQCLLTTATQPPPGVQVACTIEMASLAASLPVAGA